MTPQTKAILAGAIGIAALGVGVGAAVVAKRRRLSGLGYVKNRVHKGGMTLEEHYDPVMSINKRIKHIQQMVEAGVLDPQMRHLALAITGNRDQEVQVGNFRVPVRGARCEARDVNCEIGAIYNWTKQNIRYTGDVASIQRSDGRYEAIDFYASGKRTVEMGGEDCDGHTILNATLLTLNGITSKLRVTAPKGSMEWGHIYAVAGLPKENPTKFVAVDTTLPFGGVGTEAPHSRVRDFPA